MRTNNFRRRLIQRDIFKARGTDVSKIINGVQKMKDGAHYKASISLNGTRHYLYTGGDLFEAVAHRLSVEAMIGKIGIRIAKKSRETFAGTMESFLNERPEGATATQIAEGLGITRPEANVTLRYLKRFDRAYSDFVDPRRTHKTAEKIWYPGVRPAQLGSMSMAFIPSQRGSSYA